MIKAHWAIAWLSFSLIFGDSVYAAEPAGMVKTSKGLVSIERGHEKLIASPGTQVYADDRLRTGADGTVGVTLHDGTLLSAGPSSLIVIDRFAYDATSHDGRISIGVRRGTLAVASGKIAKKTPDSVDFHTPTSVLGVRGTEFVIEVLNGGTE